VLIHDFPIDDVIPQQVAITIFVKSEIRAEDGVNQNICIVPQTCYKYNPRAQPDITEMVRRLNLFGGHVKVQPL